MIKIMSFLKNLHCNILSCGIFAIVLLTLLAKMKETSTFSAFINNNHADVVDHHDLNILDQYGVSASIIIDYYYGVFQHLAQEGYISPTSKSLCIQATKSSDEEVIIALKRVGISYVSMFSGKSLDLFGNNTFDFAFLGQTTDQPFGIGSEICRILNYGGYLVVHVAVKDEYSFHSFVRLFTCCRLTTYRDIKGLNPTSSIREIVLRKGLKGLEGDSSGEIDDHEAIRKVPDNYKTDLVQNLEPLDGKEPSENWTEEQKTRESIELFKYLPTMVDLGYKRRYIYIDLGARTYDSTIGNWFEKLYPKQNKRFEIYAIEADKSFHQEYKRKKHVTLLPYAAWIKNETLVFGTRNKRREYTAKIQSGGTEILEGYKKEQNVVQGFDFADWLMRSFTKQDFVVLKMDVEGTEMDLIPRLLESGAIGLIDELFLECHYDRWVKCCSGKRTKRYNVTYEQCFNLFSNLRQDGTLVHQWW